MKKDLYDDEINEKVGFFSGVNTALVASVCAFLLTITVGAVVLFTMAAKSTSRIEAADDVTEIQADLRVPLAEKIGGEEEKSSDIAEVKGDSRLPGATKLDNNDIEAANDGENTDLALADKQNGENGQGISDQEQAEGQAAGASDQNQDKVEVEITDANWEHAITPANQDYVSMAFAGDILFDPNYAIMNRIRQNGGGIEGVIGGGLLLYMRSADIMVVNNEFPYSYGGSPTEGKTFTFRADPSSAELLNQMGVDVATLANNHAYDYGQTALLDTLSAIDSVGVARIGAGANLEEASHPVYYMADNGIKIAIISATEIERIDNPDTKGATDSSAGVFRCLDITKLVSRIKEAKATGAFVIVCIHWGTENKEEIDWWQEKQGPEMVEAGADLIVGAHPHILQKIGYINGVPVVYSLGNFLFNSKELETGLLRANIYKDGQVKLQFIPAIQSGCTVSEATGERKAAVLNHMRQMSAGISIDDEGNIQ
ncbi:MAG: CapA family protein [Butyrivibrio sp.]|nr:CapA family protein [Butyrivibrio sp.]